jgi:nucleotide-binding universal stress UspA family protein
VPKIERLLITVDDSPDGQLASTLAGLFAGTRQILTTVLELGRVKQPSTLLPKDKSGDLVKASAQQGARSTHTSTGGGTAAATAPALLVNHIPLAEAASAITKEMEKGYDMLFVGVARALENKEGQEGGYATSIAEVIREFKGASAVAVAKGDRPAEILKQSLNILVPTTGTDYSRRAAEVAVALAKASGGTVTALHVSPPPDVVELIRRPRELWQSGRALVRDVEELGKREGVRVIPLVKARPIPEVAILRRVRRGRHNLLVLGVKVRPGEKLFFGRRTAALLENAPCSLLIVIS